MRPAATLLLLLLSGVALASPRSDLKAGVQAADAGDHATAQELLTGALEAEEGALSGKLATRARYELGRSWLDAMVLASATGDVSALGDEPAWQAFSNLHVAGQGKGKWARLATEELETAQPVLLQEALNFHELGDLERAERDLSALVELEPTPNLLALRASVRLDAGRAEEATEDVELALQRYAAHLPEAPDPLLLTTAGTAAIVFQFLTKDADRALAIVDTANALLRADQARARDGRDEALLAEAEDTLERSELFILQTSPDHRERARARFMEAAEDNPDDAVIWTAYGSLVAEVDPETAIFILQRAVSMDPKARDAHLALAGAYLSQVTQDEARAEELLRQAYPHLLSAWEADPGDGALVDALLDLATHLGDQEGIQRWSALQEDIQD